VNLRTADLGRDDGLITSLDNPTIRFARNLQRRRVRYRERAVLVEGTRTIRTASEHGARIRALLIDARHVDTVDPILLEALVGTSERVLLVAGEPFDSVVDTAHPQPLAAICAMPDAILPSEATLVLALDGVRDPGNLGTLTRTAAAAGADAVALLPGCVDQFHPRTVRASAGTVFALPIVPVADVSAIVQQSFCTKPLVVLADAAGDCTGHELD
jgi:TrmH family RNA methyltransferase